MKFLFVGGDKRQVYAADYIKDHGDAAELVYSGEQLRALIGDADYTVLPLPFSRDGVHVNLPPDKGAISLEEFVCELKKGMNVLAGMSTDAFADRVACKGAKLYDYYKNESLTLLNSVSTAEGVIYELIGGSDIDINGSKTLVTGYGKAASAIAERLVALGSEVTVAARSERDRTAAICDRCKATSLYEIERVADTVDFVVNTVPAPVIDKKVIAKLKKSCVMLEVASAPYGIDFDAAAAHDIKVIKAPSLPGRISPASAGKAIAKTILSIVKG